MEIQQTNNDSDASNQKKSKKVDTNSERSRKEIFIVHDSIIKDIVDVGISENHSVKVRCHPGAATIDLNDYIKPVVPTKPNAMIIHSGTNNVTNNIYTLKNMAKIVRKLTDPGQDHGTKSHHPWY